MRLVTGYAVAVAVAMLVPTGMGAQGQETARAVAGGGITAPGWTGKIDANEEKNGQTLNNAKLAPEAGGLHVTTGPATTYWNPANKASGNYTVKATFKEPKYMNLNDHPHPYGIFIGGNDMGTDAQSYLYCAAYGNGQFIVRGFGPAAFQLNGPMGAVIIDSAMDQATAQQAQRGDDAKFDAEAYAHVIEAMGSASHVAVTHEHGDHIGGVLKFPLPERLAERLVLTKQQYEGLSATTKMPIPPEYAAIPHLDLTQPTRIAPGVVMIPAPGHTRGSAMFFVRLANGHELLFIGDIAWAMSNVRDAMTRPRFVQQFYMSGEDRAAVADQIRALHNLAQAEPALTIIPAHDDAYLSELVKQGLIKPQFFVDGP